MAISDLENALQSLDDQIEVLAAKAADPDSASADGMSMTKAKLKDLIDARRELAQAIVEAGGNIYEVHSKWVL